MSTEVSIAAALIAGLLSFLSPCVLPLVPPYIVYLAGVSCGEPANAPTARPIRGKAALIAALFVAGFSTVFITLGVGASAVGRLLRLYASEFAIGAGVIIILMGLHFLGLTRISLFMRQARFEMRRPIGLWGAYVMGLAFGFGWTFCVGPMLAAILAVAASDATAAKGAGLLGVYSLGLGVPFIAAAFAMRQFAAFLARFRAHLPRVE